MSKANSTGLSFVLPCITVDTEVLVANAMERNNLDYCTSLLYGSVGSVFPILRKCGNELWQRSRCVCHLELLLHQLNPQCPVLVSDHMVCNWLIIDPKCGFYLKL